MPAPNKFVVIFENERLIAVSKPSGQATIPGPGLTDEPLSAEVSRLIGRKTFVVHRLDREASGLVVFAKNAETHRRLCLDFESRNVRKTYLAAVLGDVGEDGIVEKPVRAFGSGRMGVSEGGKPSLTRYKIRKAGMGWTLLEVEPETGRRHQIRVHLFSIGHPVLGDQVYGVHRPVGGATRLMLHALELTLPEEGIPALRAEPPEDFNNVLQGLPALV